MLEEVFVKPLKSLADSSHPIMTRHEIDTIFSSIEEILVVNQSMIFYPFFCFFFKKN